MNLKVKSKKINDFTYELAISAKWIDIKEDFNSAKKKVAKEIKLNYLAITGTQFSSEITAEQNRFASSRFAKPPSLKR